MSAPVAVISNALAQQLFPGGEAIGEQVKYTLGDGREQQATVVGVTNDFRDVAADDDSRADPAAVAGEPDADGVPHRARRAGRRAEAASRHWRARFASSV
jgi:hypothetical protein